MPDPWDYVASAYAVDGDDNRINGNGDLRCPGCPLGDGNAGMVCIRGAHQQAQCVTYIQAADEYAIYQVENVAAYQTHGTTDLFPDSYVDGDAEAHDPLIGPGVGDPDYTGPYE